MSPAGTPERPVYTKVKQVPGGATNMFVITVDEGWRSSILCVDLYGWAADWLIEQIQGRPFAPGHDADVARVTERRQPSLDDRVTVRPPQIRLQEIRPFLSDRDGAG
jgi:hypothetical protein